MQKWLLLLALFLLTEVCVGSGILSIFFRYYNNPYGKTNNGKCCELAISLICGLANPCDHYFKICVDNVGGSPTDMNQCPIGKSATEVISDRNEIHFDTLIGNTPNPIEIPLKKWPGSVLLKVEVWDDDGEGPGDDLVEHLTKTFTMEASRSKAEKTMMSLRIEKRTRLDLEVAVFCDENWYGPNCDVQCVPSNDISGHYACESDGSKICLQGWTGANCTENIDDCSSGPCSRPGGQCVDKINEYVCACQPGYTGRTCEVEVEECASNPCDNNGTCLDEVGQFQCLCPEGYTGPTCKSELDECASNPCDNNATCVDEIGEFQCLCSDGYTGSTCETGINTSSCITCHNNETSSLESQKEKIFGIVLTVVLIVVFAVITLTIWKMYLKRQKQQNGPQNDDHALNDNMTVYFTAQPVQPHLTENNIYYNSEIQATTDTDAVLYDNSAYGTIATNVYGNASVGNAYETQTHTESDTYIIDNPVYGTSNAEMCMNFSNNTSGSLPGGGKTKSSEIDTVEYANALCVVNTGDVYAVVNK